MKIGLDQIYNGNISEVVDVDIVTESISPTVAVAKSVPKTQLIKEDACLIKIKDGLYVDIDNIRGLSDRIKLSLKTSSQKLIKAIQDNAEYIKNQTLAKELDIVDNISEEFSFGEEIDGDFINIGFSIFK